MLLNLTERVEKLESLVEEVGEEEFSDDELETRSEKKRKVRWRGANEIWLTKWSYIEFLYWVMMYIYVDI